nr:serine/threonine-protein phosphatase [Actinomycetota bacterium]
VLATLARALSTAVRETTLHKRARTVVDSLQRQLLPRDVRLPGGIQVGTVYRSATAGVDVGGDFFDVFTADTGHVGVACGDVSGKGVEAASLTAMAVYSLRAYALPGAPPSTVLRLLNGAVSEQTPDDRFVTLAYARIDPATFRVQLALAGHPPPLVVDGDDVRVLDIPPDVPVGTLRHATFEQSELRLVAGQSLVLYTDGVTEARQAGSGAGDPRLLGVEGLVEVVRGLTGQGPQALADGVWAAVRTWTGDGTTDDCAIIVVRCAPEPASAPDAGR